MTDNERLAYEAMMAALRVVIDANDDFRAGLPDDWEGDPMQDACALARTALALGEQAKS
jgi:hypothetical protein